MENHNLLFCEVCHKPANQTCAGCKLVYYCTRAHQKLGWREGHKSKCCAFKIQYSDSIGRHMIATRDIKPGEMILKEKAAIMGPRISSPAHCLSCAKKLKPMLNDKTLDFYKCKSCLWPMCGPECEKADIHKSECKIMTDRKYKCNIKYEQPDKTEAAYCVIAPLRVLLMRDSNPKQYENIMSLESHLEDRVNTPLYNVMKANLVTFIIQVLGMPFDEDTILRVASIMDTNAFDVRSPDGDTRYRAIYVTSSMMNHNCKPNTRHIYLDDDYKLALIATVPIAKNELIYTTYTQSLWGTLDRRRHLKTTKCFDCDCERCKDSTEAGTYLGNIYCSVCKGSRIDDVSQIPMMVSTNPLDESTKWACEKCSHTLPSKQILWGNNALKEEISKLDKTNPNAFEEFVQKYSQTLHPTNQFIVQCKLALVQIYGNYKGYALSDISEDLLKRKINLCYELLDIADVIEPGWSKFRGNLLLDLQAALSMQTKKDYEAEKLTKSAAQEKLMESMSVLKEAVEILKVEPHMKSTLESKLQEVYNSLEMQE